MKHAAVKADASLNVYRTEVVGRCHKGTDVPQPISRNENLLAQVLRALPHAANAGGKLPAVEVLYQIAHVVSQRVQTEVQTVFIGTFFILLALVLLIADGRFQTVLANPERVVPDSLVMVDVLEG